MYLHSLHIKYFRGIKDLKIEFNPNLNVLIGPNGCHKSSVIEAIRLFYEWGSPRRELEITPDDFFQEIIWTNPEHTKYELFISNYIEISYIFKGLTPKQEGAYHQYLVMESTGNTFAHVVIRYDLNENGRIMTSFISGDIENGLRADFDTFKYFNVYYLEALRDSTRALLSTRNNLLGRVIKRKIDKQGTEQAIKEIIGKANTQLLDRVEVQDTKKGINDNLEEIHKSSGQYVHFRIEQSRIEFIVNVIKPFIPFIKDEWENGLRLNQNSLGFNNLIYIATVLSDIRECHKDDDISIYALLIEEPEAHLHPQLQINLYNFLQNADSDNNSQTFITTHSPTLTSKIPFENLIVLHENGANVVSNCFIGRELEKIVRTNNPKGYITEAISDNFRKMLIRYLDVTKSQLFFSKGVILIEGISECLLINTFSELLGKSLSDNQIEIINVDGTAFYQFLMLVNSSDVNKRLPIKFAIITDGDQYTASKYVSLESITNDDFKNLDGLRQNILTGTECGRIANLRSMANNQPNIKICPGFKTLEYEIALANVCNTVAETKTTALYSFLETSYKDELKLVEPYLSKHHGNLSDDIRCNIAILLWKCVTCKSTFAQEFNQFILNNRDKTVFVPDYIKDAIDHLIN